ncbi:MAG: hypothetical protein PVI30_01020 [Myxococcales bacterium]
MGPRVDYGFKPAELRALVAAARNPGDGVEGAEPTRDEVESHAGFGVAPDRVLLSPLYAAAVWRRRRELQREVAPAQDAREQAREKALEALVTLGERLRRRAGEDSALDGLRDLCERAEQAQGTAQDRIDVHDVVQEQEQVQLEHHEQAIATAEREVEPLLKGREAAERKATKAATELERARAMVKRSEIELRALENAERSDPARRSVVESERSKRIEQAGVAQEADERARAALSDAQTELDRALASVRERQAAHDALLEEQRLRQREYEASVDQARGALDDVLVDLSARAFEKQLVALEDAQSTLDRFRELADADRALAVALAAPDAHDTESYRAGLITATVGLLGLFAALAWLLA